MPRAAGQPWLSIVMPAFNGARYVAEALASVEQQGFDDLEVVVVEDGSTDATPAILASFAHRLPLRIVQGPRRGNWVAATNVGIGAARGVYACMLHQDDGYLPARISGVRALVARHPEAALWIHPARFYDHLSRDVGPWRCPLANGLVPPSVMLQRLLVQNFIAMPGPTFRLADAHEVGGLNEDLWYTADWDFWLKLAKLGPTAYVSRELGFFRVHGDSQTVRRSGNLAAFREQMTMTHERHVASLADPALEHAVSRAARLSVEINVALASALHGGRTSLSSLVAALSALDFDAAWRFGRDARLLERLGARLRARLAAPERAD